MSVHTHLDEVVVKQCAADLIFHLPCSVMSVHAAHACLAHWWTSIRNKSHVLPY